MKYISKPIVIEAIQFTGDNLDEVFNFCEFKTPRKKIRDIEDFIRTMLGHLRKNLFFIKDPTENCVVTMGHLQFERKYKRCEE